MADGPVDQFDEPRFGVDEKVGNQPPHIPVMIAEVSEALSPLDNKTIVDGTFGAGGYTRAFVSAGARVIALDQDPTAIAAAVAGGIGGDPNVKLHEARFSQLDGIVGERAVDGVVLDIGVSSMQLDRAERGFSFKKDGPLDMRMSIAGPSAADVVNTMERGDLLRVIGILGEERNAPRIATAIVEARRERPIETTRELASIVENASPGRGKDRIHPATRTFQGLRIYVNDELGELVRGLEAAEKVLRPGGILAVVTFHSLEDRIVKRFIADRSGGTGGSRHMPSSGPATATFEPTGKQGRGPSDEEIARNPRARSARLRTARRTDGPASSAPGGVLPNLPPLSSLRSAR